MRDIYRPGSPVRSVPPRCLLPSALMQRALTARCGDSNPLNNNEKLEFFGDAVVEVGIRALVLQARQGLHEAHLKSQRVRSSHALAMVADKWNVAIVDLRRCGRCMACAEPRKQLADVVEAIVGALCTHVGLAEASTYIEREFSFLLDVLDFRPAFEPGVAIREILADYGSPKVESTDNGLRLAVTIKGRQVRSTGATALHAQFRLYRALRKESGR